MLVHFQGFTRSATRASQPSDSHDQMGGSDAQAEKRMRDKIFASTQRHIDEQHTIYRKTLHAIYQEDLASLASNASVAASVEDADGEADDLLEMLEAGQF